MFDKRHKQFQKRKHFQKLHLRQSLKQTPTTFVIMATLTFSHASEFPGSFCETKKFMLNLRVTAPDVASDDDNKRAPVSLSAVIDKSGSMAGSKMDLVKKTCNFMLAQLGRRDNFGLVEYDSNVYETIPLSNNTINFQEEAKNLIDTMSSGTCTNLSGGLFSGIQQQRENMCIHWDDSQPRSLVEVQGQEDPEDHAMKRFRNVNTKKARQKRRIFGNLSPPAKVAVKEDAVRSVFLFTDGLANVGIQGTELVTACKGLLDCKNPPKVITFGFGEDHDEALLSKLSECAHGQYYFIENEEKISTAFADALGGLLSVAAQNLILTISISDGVEMERLHTPFATETVDNQTTKINVGDLISEESKDILLQLKLPAIAPQESILAADFKVASVHASWYDVNTVSFQNREITLCVRRMQHVPVDIKPDLKVSLQCARVQTVEAIAEASEMARVNDFEQARAHIDKCLKSVKAVVDLATRDNNHIVSALATVLVNDLQEAIENTSNANVYQSRGAKAMRMRGACRSRQVADPFTPMGPDSPFLTTGENDEVSVFTSGNSRQRMTKMASSS